MKLMITAVATMFSLFMLISPGHANADPGNRQSPAIQQVEYSNLHYVGFWGGRPLACHNRYFRRHHWHLCR